LNALRSAGSQQCTTYNNNTQTAKIKAAAPNRNNRRKIYKRRRRRKLWARLLYIYYTSSHHPKSKEEEDKKWVSPLDCLVFFSLAIRIDIYVELFFLSLSGVRKRVAPAERMRTPRHWGHGRKKGPSSSSSESKAKKHDPPPPAADQLCLLATLYNEGVDIKCSSISTWSIICSRQTRLFIDGWWRTIHIEAALGPVRKVRDEVYTIFGLRCGGS
jgi:hypothetical protein